MRDVVIHVTGRSYSLGVLMPGGSCTKYVTPTSESNVQVEFTDERGRRIRLDGEGYFEPRYNRGTIEIQVDDGQVVSVKNTVR